MIADSQVRLLLRNIESIRYIPTVFNDEINNEIKRNLSSLPANYISIDKKPKVGEYMQNEVLAANKLGHTLKN